MTESEITPATLTDAALLINTLLDRTRLAQALGQKSYGGQRDYNTVLGYPVDIDFEHYLARYERQDIAGRVVDLPAKDTWKKPPLVSENDRVDTPFVAAWNSLEKRLKAWSKLSRVDRISGIGQYGILLIGIRDGKKMREPAEKGTAESPDDILFLKPLSEGSALIKTKEKDDQNPRFDFPLTYKVTLLAGSKIAHWTRAIHVADGKIDSEVLGTPRLRQVWNRLEDLMKIVGGSAEATWLNMRPGTLLTTQPDYKFEDTDAAKTALQNEIEEYLHGVARMITMEGIDVKQLAGQMMDPTPGFDVEIALISAASGIPQRVLLGSASGELAAAKEDMRQWFGTVAERQTNYAEPEILRPFIDRLIWLGALPKPAGGVGAYDIGMLDEQGDRRWPTLFQLTEEELSTVSLQRAQAIRALFDPVTGQFIVPDEVLAKLIDIPITGTQEATPETMAALQLQQARIIAGNHRNGSLDDERYLVYLNEERDRLRSERAAAN